MEVARRFGENLRQIRKTADLSQEKLGRRCSLHRTEIGLLERGARVPRIDTLIKIASGLGVRIDCVLLDGITWTPSTTEAGTFTISSRVKHPPALIERAAALRARQAEPVDVVELVREGREELERRGFPLEEKRDE